MKQLNDRVNDIQNGKVEPEISRNAEIFPVVVTYDDIGGDNVGMYRWIDDTRIEHAVLQQSKVRPVTFIPITTFEVFLGVAAHGVSMLDVLDKKTDKETKLPWHEARLSVLLSKVAPKSEELYLPGLKTRFEDLKQEIVKNLFGQSAG